MEETRDNSNPDGGAGRSRWALYAALLVLYLLHNDLWLWNEARLILGLPVGLLYHVGFCIVTSVVLAMLVKWAWPALDTNAEEDLAPSREDGGEWSPKHQDSGR